MAREWTLRVLLIVISVSIALGLAEVMARAFFPIADGRDNVMLDGTPINEWFPPGTVYRQVSNEYDALTTITDKGHRVPGVEGNSNPDVIFVGDSFTYGFGLADHETFASIYCNTLRLACVNLGKPGSGTLQQVERLRQFITKYGWKPKEVKLFFFGMSGSFSAGNDFVDNYHTYVREHGGEVDAGEAGEYRRHEATFEGGLIERLISYQELILDKSMLMRLVKFYWGPIVKSVLIADFGRERMAIALQATKEYLALLDEMSRTVGFSYTIYLISPVHDIIRGTDRDTLAVLNSVSPVPVIPTADLFRDRPQDYSYAYDGHVNARGARKIAEFLVSRELTHTAQAP